jgi:hypothetical protein
MPSVKAAFLCQGYLDSVEKNAHSAETRGGLDGLADRGTAREVVYVILRRRAVRIALPRSNAIGRHAVRVDPHVGRVVVDVHDLAGDVPVGTVCLIPGRDDRVGGVHDGEHASQGQQ